MPDVQLAEYRLILMGPPVSDANWRAPIASTAVGISSYLLRETEENMTKLLPEKYSVQIRPVLRDAIGTE